MMVATLSMVISTLSLTSLVTGAVGPAAVPAKAAPAAGPAWQCTTYGYLFQSPNQLSPPHNVQVVDLATGVVVRTLHTADQVNAVGYNTFDNYMYGWDWASHQIVRIAGDGSLEGLGVPTGLPNVPYLTGAFDDAGHLWLASSANYGWAEVDYAPGSSTYGQVIDSGKLDQSLVVPDWSWVNGQLYGVRTVDGVVHLIRFDPSDGSSHDVGALKGPNAWSGAGATYTDGTYLYASNNELGPIYRIDPATLVTTLVTAKGPPSASNDGARCAKAPIPTLTVTKKVDGRVAPADQFTVGLGNSAGDVLASASTTGTDTSAATTNQPVSQGATYTITDAMANGSTSNLDAYDAGIVCTDETAGQTVMTGGESPAWTMTVTDPHDYTCVVTNTAKPVPLTLTKASNATSATRVGDTVTYTVTAKNPGPADYTADNPASVIDDLSGVLDDGTYGKDAKATVGGAAAGTVSYAEPNLSWTGPLASGASVKITYTVKLNKLGDFDAHNTAYVPDCTPGDDGCAPSTPTQCENSVDPATGLPCAETDQKLPHLTIAKTSPDVADARVGDTVHYTVTATNDGAGDFTTAGPARFIDDLSGVLDDATWGKDASADVGSVEFTAPDLSWQGVLTAGQKATVTYSVTYTGKGDRKIDNVAFTTDPCTAGGNCPVPPTPKCDASGPMQSVSCVNADKPDLTITKTSPDLTGASVGDTVHYTVTATNNGPGDFTTSNPAVVLDDLSGVLDDATYNGDATATQPGDVSYTEPRISWSGALAAGATVSVTYTVTLTGAGDKKVDNVAFVADCVPGSAGCDAPPTPTCDPESSTVACVNGDLPDPVITKSSPDVKNAKVGDTVHYTVTLTNKGPGDYTADRPARLLDDLTGVLDDGSYNSDAKASVKGDLSYTAPRIQWVGSLKAGKKVSVTYSVTLTGAGDTDVKNVAFVPDCTPGSDGCDNAPTPTCDPKSPTVACVDAPLPKLDLVKSSKDLAGAHVGDTVHYTVTATNVGKGDYTKANPAVVLDDLSGVLDDASYNADAKASAKGDLSYTTPRIQWVGSLASGDKVSITYSVTLTGQGDFDVRNVAFEPPCTPGAKGCDNPPTPPAPKCQPSGVDKAGLPVGCVDGKLPALDLVKTSKGVAGAQVGDTVTYTVTATNVGAAAYTKADPAVVLDDLTGVLDDATYDKDAKASRSGDLSYTAPRIEWSGALPAGKKVSITYTVTLTGQGDFTMRNVAFQPPCVPGADGCDDPKTPPAPDCQASDTGSNGLPTACVQDRLPNLSITKTSPDVDDAQVGDTVHYTVTVTNTGTGDYTKANPASAIDDLTGVLDDATFNSDAKASAGTVSYAQPRLVWTGPIKAGSEVSITYSVTLTAGGDLDVKNVAFLPGCTPGTDGCDVPPTPTCPVDMTQTAAAGTDMSVACVDHQLPQLSITKTSKDLAGAKVGDTVHYTVTATNTGKGDYTKANPASVLDDLTGVLDDATYDNDAKASVKGDLSYAEPRIQWVGLLKAGEKVSITYSVTLTAAGDLDLLNVAFVPDCTPGADGCDPATPPAKACTNDADAGSVACVDRKLPHLVSTKQASTDAATDGGTVSYTVTIANTGPGAFTKANPAVVTDDLTGVLDDATYNGDATASAGAVDYAKPVLTWTGALTPGGQVTVTYSVTVHTDKAGDMLLHNVVVSHDPTTPKVDPPADGGDTCAADPTGNPDPYCHTDTPVNQAPGLPNTGATVSSSLAGLAGILILAGFGCLAYSRRRRTHRG